MKNTLLIVLIMFIASLCGFSQSFTDITCVPQPVYGYRSDGKPGRELLIKFLNGRLTARGKVEIDGAGLKENTSLTPSTGGDSVCTILLPYGLGVQEDDTITITLNQGNTNFKKQVIIPAMRYWSVFLYAHSHVDIGYTNTQQNVELLHRSNILEGIKLADSTAHFPEGAQYKWNPEVTWPVERLWHEQPEDRNRVLMAIKAGKLSIDASYVNTNTSIGADEELFHMFRFSRYLQRLTGKPMDAFQQVDIPGITWGMVPVMAQEGVKYVVSWINGGDRVGNAHRFGLNGYPFWWIGPDRQSKVLFFQPGAYANKHSVDKGGKTGRPWFGQRDLTKIPAVIKTGYANIDFTDRLMVLEREKYPYDFLAVSWTLWDNTPLDADIPDAVKAWNERYAYPKITITGGHDMMQYIERKYGDQLPEVTGDYTEYWIDGIGSAARLAALNRNAKERLIQAEKLWSMLSMHRDSPRNQLDEAWRLIALGSEHTWCFENPSEPYFQDAIFKVKQRYFQDADVMSREMLDQSLAPVTDKSDGGLGPLEGPAAGGIVVLNTNSWAHDGLVTLTKSESMPGDKVVDEQGLDVPAQRLTTGELVFMAADVPALGSRHYRVVAGGSDFPAVCTLTKNVLNNGELHVVVDTITGNITQLLDLKTGYNYADGNADGGLNTFRWLPGNINSPVPDSLVKIDVVENGPLLVRLQLSSQGKGVRSVKRSIQLVAGQAWVEFDNEVDKLPLLEKDGIHFGFGFNIPNARTRVDIPWGIMEVEKDQWPQANRNWFALQRWLDISNDQKGITWCSLDAPLFEYGGMTANNAHGWGNGGDWIERLESSSTIYSWVMNNHWHTNFPLSQEGPVRFRYRIMPHGTYDATKANRFGMEQAQPLVHVSANKDPKVDPLVSIDNEHVVVSIVKPTDEPNTYILRLRSLSDREEAVRLSFPHHIQSVYLCNQEELPGEEVHGEIDMLPFGMVTLQVKW